MALNRSWRVALALCSTFACGRVTGIDDYEIVDCPSGTCTDAPNDEDASSDAAADVTPVPRDAESDAGTPPPTCPGASAPVTVKNQSAARITSNPPGIDAVPGQTDATCFSVGQNLRLETSSAVTWSGASCARGTRCEFVVPTSGIVITATP